MNYQSVRPSSTRKNSSGFTLVEMMIAAAVGSVVLTVAFSLWMFSARSFAALGNYTDLDSKSRNALDAMLRDIRNATGVGSFQRNGSNNWINLTYAELPGVTITYSWSSSSRKLVRQTTGQPDRTYLTECDLWDFHTYQRYPLTNGAYLFFPATNSSGSYDPGICKLVDVTWKCSRTILGKKVNTESVQTAQVVLRNKQ